MASVPGRGRHASQLALVIEHVRRLFVQPVSVSIDQRNLLFIPIGPRSSLEHISDGLLDEAGAIALPARRSVQGAKQLCRKGYGRLDAHTAKYTPSIPRVTRVYCSREVSRRGRAEPSLGRARASAS